MFSDSRILSQPVRVMWMGWESDTVRMQRSGWDLAVDYDPSYDRYRMIARHEHYNLWGWAPDWVEIPKAYSSVERSTATEIMHRQEMLQRTCFVFTHFTQKLEVIRVQEMGAMNFQQIDAEPFMQTNFSPGSIEDFNIFRIKKHEEEVFIDEANLTVLDHLQAIKDLQSEDQKRIRERMLKEDRSDPETEIITHANVVSLRRA